MNGTPLVNTADDSPRVEALKKSGACRIVRSVESFDDLFSQLTLAFDVPQPNPEGLPGTVELDCRIRHPYPFGEIELIPKGSEVSGFAHQAADGGKLCLPSAQDAPWNEYRLLQYAEWAKEWIVYAAHGQLLKVGDPYELPDFRQNETPDPAFKQVLPILFDESAATLAAWDARVGQAGTVSLASCKAANAIAATDWFASDKNAVRRSPFSPAFLRGAHRFTGQWILLPKMTSVRARPPRTYEELATLCRTSNVQPRKCAPTRMGAWPPGPPLRRGAAWLSNRGDGRRSHVGNSLAAAAITEQGWHEASLQGPR